MLWYALSNHLSSIYLADMQAAVNCVLLKHPLLSLGHCEDLNIKGGRGGQCLHMPAAHEDL